MTPAAHPSTLVLVGLGAFILLRMYSRIRRLVGRQRLSRVRPWITVCVFPVILAMLALVSLANPIALSTLGAGIAVGAVLGVVGHRLTKFENTPEGFFYTPNAHIGIALSLLLAGRILYRIVQMYLLSEPSAASNADFVASPITLAIIGTLAGYYVSYAIGLLRWRHAVTSSRG